MVATKSATTLPVTFYQCSLRAEIESPQKYTTSTHRANELLTDGRMATKCDIIKHIQLTFIR